MTNSSLEGCIALISVSDKTGVADFTRGLVELGLEIVSTGGTFAEIDGASVPVTPIEKITGLPSSFLGGRVKTLHPSIFGGILARRDSPEDVTQLKHLEIKPVAVVAVNFYDFTGKPGNEQIDIGGPSLLRAAAKNREFCLPVPGHKYYEDALVALEKPDAYTTTAKLFASITMGQLQSLIVRFLTGFLIRKPSPKNLAITSKGFLFTFLNLRQIYFLFAILFLL